MKKILSLMVLIAAVFVIPGCCWCKKQEAKEVKEGRETGPQQHLSERDMK